MDNEISAVMTATMSKIKEMVDTNTVVGEPITTPDDITLIPLSRVSFAFASGGSEFPMKENKNGVGCGSGAGVKVEPMGFPYSRCCQNWLYCRKTYGRANCKSRNPFIWFVSGNRKRTWNKKGARCRTSWNETG